MQHHKITVDSDLENMIALGKRRSTVSLLVQVEYKKNRERAKQRHSNG